MSDQLIADNTESHAQMVAAETTFTEVGFLGEQFFDVLVDGEFTPSQVMDKARDLGYVVDRIGEEGGKTSIRFRFEEL